MPVSQRKLDANRRNAAKSTGPRTAEGKAKSSRNALHHGMFCKDLVLPGEDEAMFHALRDGLLESLRPRDPMQWMLADRIVSSTWKLRRLQEAEHLIYENQRTELEREEAEDDSEMASFRKKYPMPGSLVMSIMMRESEELERFQQYELRLEMSICRCRRELRQLQKRDEEKHTPWLGETLPPLEEENDKEEPDQSICENEPTAASGPIGGTGASPVLEALKLSKSADSPREGELEMHGRGAHATQDGPCQRHANQRNEATAGCMATYEEAKR